MRDADSTDWLVIVSMCLCVIVFEEMKKRKTNDVSDNVDPLCCL